MSDRFNELATENESMRDKVHDLATAQAEQGNLVEKIASEVNDIKLESGALTSKTEVIAMDMEEKMGELTANLTAVSENQANFETTLSNQMQVTDRLSQDLSRSTNQIQAVVQNVQDQITV